MKRFFFALFTVITFSGFSQSKTGSYPVGVRTFYLEDNDRSYTTRNGKSISRPLQVMFWYPAAEGSAAPTFSYYWEQWKQEEGVQAALSEPEAIAFAQNSVGIEKEQLVALKQVPISATPEAKPLSGDFPLIVYTPGYQSPAFENFQLCEALAQQGYWVMAMPWLGAERYEMEKSVETFEARWQDLRLLLAQARKLAGKEQSTTLMGFSWGGIFNQYAWQKGLKTQALISLDGSERNGFYRRVAIGFSADLRKEVDVPFLFLSKETEEVDPKFFSEVAGKQLYFKKIPESSHEDFSAIFQVLDPGEEKKERYEMMQSEVLRFLDLIHQKKSYTSEEIGQFQSFSTGIIPQKSQTSSVSNSKPVLLKGKVTEQTNQFPIPFMNIGVLGENIGTTTDMEGNFELSVPAKYAGYSLTFSAIGYEKFIAPISKLAEKNPIRIELTEQVTQLEEVVIRATETLRSAELGNGKSSYGTRFSGGSGSSGAAMAILVEAPDTPFRLKTAKLKINDNNLQNFKIRFRIKSVNEEGLPGEELLLESPVITSSINKGWVEVDFSERPIWLFEQQFFLMCEWYFDPTLSAKIEARNQEIQQQLKVDYEAGKKTVERIEYSNEAGEEVVQYDGKVKGLEPLRTYFFARKTKKGEIAFKRYTSLGKWYASEDMMTAVLEVAF